MVKGRMCYISKSLELIIKKEKSKMKSNKRMKGTPTFIKACDVIARRLKQ